MKSDDNELKLNELQENILDLTKENDALKKEMSELKRSIIAFLAELENVKRRKEQEKVDAIKFANGAIGVGFVAGVGWV